MAWRNPALSSMHAACKHKEQPSPPASSQRGRTLKASASTRGMSASAPAWPAHLTCPATAPSWSHSWKAPFPTSSCGSWLAAGQGRTQGV